MRVPAPLAWLLAAVLAAASGAAASGAAASGAAAQAAGDAPDVRAEIEGDALAGRDLARAHCARCHVIKDYNPYGSVGNSPSFDGLVRRADGLWRIATFFDRPPHAAFVRVEGVAPPSDLPPAATPFTLSARDLEDLVSYAAALRRAQAGD